MLTLKEYIKNPRITAVVLLEHFGQWMSDKSYLKLAFRIKMGYRLDLKQPNSFSEKLQWLKLYDRNPLYTTMVDKYAVKKYVADIIGDEYIIPTLGVWDKPENIEWDLLPDSFVLKTTHGGGSTGVIICREKKDFDRKKAIESLNVSMKQDIYKYSKEWPYKNVKPRIIAETYVQPEHNTNDLPDYKWYCFNGEPKYCQVIKDRHDNETIDFFDTEWNHQEFVGLNPVFGPYISCAKVEPSKPIDLEKQVEIAQKLSKGLPFSRIDLYEVNGSVFFGEITFYPMSGFGVFSPSKYNEILGANISLPKR